MADNNLSEDQARALWERAARLQAESAAKDLIAAPKPDDEETPPTPTGTAYSVDVVRKSAVEAGIPAEFIEKALEEMEQAGAEKGKVDLWADKYLGDEDRVLKASKIVEETPERVYSAMGRVFPNRPYGLNLVSTDGKTPTEGGVLTFEVPYAMGLGIEGGAPSKAITNIRHWADIKELKVRLSPVEGPDGAVHTEVEVWASIAHSRRLNYWVGNSIGGAVGVVGALITAVIAGNIIDPSGVTSQIVATLAIGAGGGFGTFKGIGRLWRPAYRYGMNKGRSGMEQLIDALVVDLHTGGAFATRPEALPTNGVKGMFRELGL